MPGVTRIHLIFILVTAALLASGQISFAQNEYDAPRIEQLLPDSLQQNLDINAWGWFSYLHDSAHSNKDYWNVDVALGGTLRLGDRVAATADIHLWDTYDGPQGFLEQAFLTANALPDLGTLITAGKFNADIGVEARNEWDRPGGTASLLFGAIPQDLIGLELTQPIGNTDVTIKPFLANDFDGNLNSHGPPSGGAIMQYQPVHGLKMALTNWVGPGLVPGPYMYTGYAYENWMGTDLDAKAIAGTLYLVDANITWQATAALSLSAEGVFAENRSHPGWSGFAFWANYDITDNFHAFLRYSYLNDNQWLVTGITQVTHEISGGLGYEFVPGLELRGEVRHDGSNRTGNVDSFSVHLVFGY